MTDRREQERPRWQRLEQQLEEDEKERERGGMRANPIIAVVSCIALGILIIALITGDGELARNASRVLGSIR
jgi:hypothetical protein